MKSGIYDFKPFAEVKQISNDPLEGKTNAPLYKDAPASDTYNIFQNWHHGEGQQLDHQTPWAYWACNGDDWTWQESQIGPMKVLCSTLLETRPLDWKYLHAFESSSTALNSVQ